MSLFMVIFIISFSIFYQVVLKLMIDDPLR